MRNEPDVIVHDYKPKGKVVRHEIIYLFRDVYHYRDHQQDHQRVNKCADELA
jgi:hypothetical protein